MRTLILQDILEIICYTSVKQGLYAIVEVSLFVKRPMPDDVPATAGPVEMVGNPTSRVR